MNTSTLNQNPIPQAPMTTNDYHRSLNMIIILTVIAVIIGLIYWWTNSTVTQPQSVVTQADIRAHIAALLNSTHVQPSQQEMASIAARLTLDAWCSQRSA